MTTNRGQVHPSLPNKSVHLHVDRPVLDYYNKMSLNKNIRSDRIKHKSTSSHCHQPLLVKMESRHSDTQSNQEWEKTVSRYMQSKKAIEARRKQNTEFGFHRLDKNNRHLYIKLITDQRLPVNIVNLARQEESYAREEEEMVESGFVLKRRKENRTEVGEDTREVNRFNERRERLNDKRERERPKRSMGEPYKSYTEVQEKIMGNFITNYFRGKHKQAKKSP